MSGYFVDSNVFLRFYTADDPRQQAEAQKIFLKAKAGELELYCGPPVFFEIAWVLNSRYKIPLAEILDKLESILAIPKEPLNKANSLTYARFLDCFAPLAKTKKLPSSRAAGEVIQEILTGYVESISFNQRFPNIHVFDNDYVKRVISLARDTDQSYPDAYIATVAQDKQIGIISFNRKHFAKLGATIVSARGRIAQTDRKDRVCWTTIEKHTFFQQGREERQTCVTFIFT
jgi:predicted nucleic acid-binding protein